MKVDIDYLRSRIRDGREVVGELVRLTSKPFSELSLDERYSMRYQIVVLVEVLGSICLHVAVEDLGCEPKSYGECFKLLQDRDIVESAEDLVKVVRLRNLLVHRYWVVDDKRIYKSVKGNFKCAEEFLKRVADRYGI